MVSSAGPRRGSVVSSNAHSPAETCRTRLPGRVKHPSTDLRRALEALLDLGRHVLAKGFTVAPAEYKEVADELTRAGVLSERDSALLRQMAGYRNRLVHFYHEISQEELYALCSLHLPEVEHVCEAVLKWLQGHPDKLDRTS